MKAAATALAALLAASTKPVAVAPPVRLPGFAAALADRPLVTGPAAWPVIARGDAWTAIRRSTPADRQAARWSFALSLLGAGYGADAIGVLEVMQADDPDLALVPAWQRARGVALVGTGRFADAVAALEMPELARDPEACLWRLRALAALPNGAARALGQLRCAVPAVDARRGKARAPFVIAASRAALAIGKPDAAIGWLAALPDGDPEANLLRGTAYLARGRPQDGRLRLARVALTGTAAQRAEARLVTIENGVATQTLGNAEARRRLAALRFAWRGDVIERRATELSLRLAEEAHDVGDALSAGAVLFRNFDLGADAAPLSARMQAHLAGMMAPGSRLPVATAAGLFWDYRDLAPAGIEGLRLLEGLTARLQGAGLYGRAADLLAYRLDAGAQDVERGALSIRIASLRILAGDPEAAVRVLRATDAVAYPPAMVAERRRIEAAALSLTGRANEALAALDDVPGAGAERAEIFWRAHDWQRLVTVGEPALPPPGKLTAVGQAIILRHAIGLAMLGREEALGRLGQRYAAAFATLPTAQTFTLLTGNPAKSDPAALARAMAALPTVSPSGTFGDLLDQGAAAKAETAG